MEDFAGIKKGLWVIESIESKIPTPTGKMGLKIYILDIDKYANLLPEKFPTGY